MQEYFNQLIEGHRKAFERSFSKADVLLLEKIAGKVIKTLKSGNKLLLCGNGGSAADSQHIAAEFIVRFRVNRRSLPAIALTTDASILTAAANDFDFESIFSRQVEGLGVEGDLLIAISTSGNSANVIQAVRAAREKKIQTVAFSGRDGGELSRMTEESFIVKSDTTAHIQEMHIFALHAVCEVVEKVLFS